MIASVDKEPIPNHRALGASDPRQQQDIRHYRLAYLVSHPIQYQAPLLRLLTAQSNIDLHVFFLSDFSVRSYRDSGFGDKWIEWDVPLLDGYRSEILPALGSRELVDGLRPLSYGLTQRLRRGRFDALWMHGWSHPTHLRAFASAKFLGIPVMLRAESRLGSVRGDRTGTTTRERILRRLFAAADSFLSIGSANSEYYRHYGVPDNKIFMVPYAVDNDFFQRKVGEAKPDRENLRAALSLMPDRPVILFASKFVKRKRAADVLEAYIKMSPDGRMEPLPYLIFAGDGEQREILETRTRELGWNSIRFLGFQNQTQLPALFDLCDVFVLISEREPWGLIVNEVMNAAKPVIVSDQVGAARDLVSDTENGFVVPVGNIDLLAARLKEITSNPSLAARMGQDSLKRLARWSFSDDVTGINAALAATRDKCRLRIRADAGKGK